MGTENPSQQGSLLPPKDGDSFFLAQVYICPSALASLTISCKVSLCLVMQATAAPPFPGACRTLVHNHLSFMTEGILEDEDIRTQAWGDPKFLQIWRNMSPQESVRVAIGKILWHNILRSTPYSVSVPCPYLWIRTVLGPYFVYSSILSMDIYWLLLCKP